MTRDGFDIVVAGAGLAGKLAAVVFASAGFKVACCDPRQEALAGALPGDNRVTALLFPAKRVLERAEIWEGVQANGCALPLLRIVDAGANPVRSGCRFDFQSSEIGHECFGWTVTNTALHDLLNDRIARLPSLTMMRGCKVVQVATRMAEVRCKLSDGIQIQSRLLVAADGKDSTVRGQLGIGCRRALFEAFALSFNVRHPRPNEGVTVEIHGKGESITVIPMPGDDCQSSVVWTTDQTRASELADLDDEQFLSRLQDGLMDHAGEVAGVSRRAIWQSRVQLANRFGDQRAVLIGEAAHVLSPVGAQGFNTTVADVDALSGLLLHDRIDPGAPSVVSSYERQRRTDVHLRTVATYFLQMAAISRLRPLQGTRRLGLKAIYGVSSVRRAIMRAGMGRGSGFPAS